MLKVDKATSIHSRGRFARIYVKIDLSKKLVPRISVLGNILNIEYEGLHLICFNCGIYGHWSESCGEISATGEVHRAAVEEGKQVEAEGVLEAVNHGKQEKISNNLSIDNKSENNQNLPEFGPWMMVRKLQKRKPGKRNMIGDFLINTRISVQVRKVLIST
ncbi:hypothetical protein Ahy_B05g076023 [Arachis hypogaea]|uniref:CCHC-type domain-containing protein n=1 Tax=Arachis hypogaea TaxID=3818 RepID=A0A444Z2G1_ARAHY|nr:hypothetical protein Ahy_B05g076023 [Arachis hypogaea]